jgi:hypothetical protein
LPTVVNTGGKVCSGGEGKALVITSSSSWVPVPVVEHTGTTGKNDARATAVSRSSTSSLRSISSPPM